MSEIAKPDNYRDKEIELRERELKLKEDQARKINPILLGIIGAIVGLLSNALVSYLNGINQIKHARHILQHELILDAVKSDSIQKNKENLEFILSAGLIPDYDDEIKQIINDPKYNPKFINNLRDMVNILEIEKNELQTTFYQQEMQTRNLRAELELQRAENASLEQEHQYWMNQLRKSEASVKRLESMLLEAMEGN